MNTEINRQIDKCMNNDKQKLRKKCDMAKKT